MILEGAVGELVQTRRIDTLAQVHSFALMTNEERLLEAADCWTS